MKEIHLSLVCFINLVLPVRAVDSETSIKNF